MFFEIGIGGSLDALNCKVAGISTENFLMNRIEQGCFRQWNRLKSCGGVWRCKK